MKITNKREGNRDFRDGNRKLSRKEELGFNFKNSLIITPYAEVEFESGGGIRYVKNHENGVLIVGDRFYLYENNISKIPLLIGREIKKNADEKKITVSEHYEFNSDVSIRQNISLFYNENKIDINIKTIGTDIFSDTITTNYSVPELLDVIKYQSSDNLRINTVLTKDRSDIRNCRQIEFECENSVVSTIFSEDLHVKFKNKYSSVFLNGKETNISFVFKKK